MLNLSKYLEKFSKGISDNNLNKKLIQEILERFTAISFESSDLDIKENILYINTTPAKKNKVFIFKQKILDELSSISIKDVK